MYSFIDWNIGDKKGSRAHLLFSLLHLLERDGSVAVVVELLDDRLDLLHRQVLPGQLQLTLVTIVYLQLGKPSCANCAVFLNIVQKGGGVKPMFKNFVANILLF